MDLKELELYRCWLANAVDDADLQVELKSIENDEEAINDRFYRDLEFGTGGLRGVLGAGTNRMNIYTIRRATQGLADFVKESYENPSVAISFDSRIKSDVFARAAAEVLAANGIHVHIYNELAPTPMLSYAVRALNCNAGIMVTASHNPAKYNGYKAYGADGCQMTIEDADAVLAKINALDMFDGVKHMPFADALEAAVCISFLKPLEDVEIVCITGHPRVSDNFSISIFVFFFSFMSLLLRAITVGIPISRS
jgi:phosphoglucomutase